MLVTEEQTVSQRVWVIRLGQLPETIQSRRHPFPHGNQVAAHEFSLWEEFPAHHTHVVSLVDGQLKFGFQRRNGRTFLIPKALWHRLKVPVGVRYVVVVGAGNHGKVSQVVLHKIVYNLAQQPMAFADNTAVKSFLERSGADALAGGPWHRRRGAELCPVA
jgi:hypothetical protein